ncbi:glutathione S-transferase family protein [Rhizobium sp. RMa-01]|uniref:glutathione S-transferase family protein n=1 Tax=unclassified Rhizobium TaxID=2613769 RepID=UPI0008D8E6DF|nr:MULTISPECIES: glutathione S-transferase family protein [unclassified Rhizobium]OHV26746.1 glutathione S-transferase [Rhizobium sp. RSm-3]RVU12446.1 glutathione S-transferase family protein [Rhizobium sp. RMa-01]
MSPILFYGVPEGCSFGSIVALEWSGLPYRLCRVEMPEMVSSDDYLRINPVGETPSLLLEDGRVISESMAILQHIGARAIGSGRGFAQGSEDFDRLNQMLAFLNTSFFKAFGPLWYAFEHPLEPQQKQALAAYGIAAVEKAHHTLERLLDGRDWLVGNGPSLADAYFVGIARWNDFHKVVDRRQFPGLHRLYERMQQQPAVQFAHAIEHRQEVKSSGGFLGEVDLTEALGLLKQAA